MRWFKRSTEPSPSFDGGAFLGFILDAVEHGSGDPTVQCPICKAGDWTIVEGRILHSLDVGQDFKLVPLVCGNCGFVAQFAAE